MNKIAIVALILFGVVSQVAQAADSDPLYLTTGFTDFKNMDNLQFSPQETQHVALGLGLGWNLNQAKTIAVELGYMGSTGASSSLPGSVIQRQKSEMWQASFFGKKALSDNTTLTGRIGMIQISSLWEMNGSVQSQNSSREYNRNAALFGAGLMTKIANNTYLHFEALKSPALPYVTPKVYLVFDL